VKLWPIFLGALNTKLIFLKSESVKADNYFFVKYAELFSFFARSFRFYLQPSKMKD
jgi:hypothetical protein